MTAEEIIPKLSGKSPLVQGKVSPRYPVDTPKIYWEHREKEIIQDTEEKKADDGLLFGKKHQLFEPPRQLNEIYWKNRRTVIQDGTLKKAESKVLTNGGFHFVMPEPGTFQPKKATNPLVIGTSIENWPESNMTESEESLSNEEVSEDEIVEQASNFGEDSEGESVEDVSNSEEVSQDEMREDANSSEEASEDEESEDDSSSSTNIENSQFIFKNDSSLDQNDGSSHGDNSVPFREKIALDELDSESESLQEINKGSESLHPKPDAAISKDVIKGEEKSEKGSQKRSWLVSLRELFWKSRSYTVKDAAKEHDDLSPVVEPLD